MFVLAVVALSKALAQLVRLGDLCVGCGLRAPLHLHVYCDAIAVLTIVCKYRPYPEAASAFLVFLESTKSE
jgi:hypothetical protein